ncbi:hypothetical protein OUZ56_010306 [Daphnia magna]|uniref:Uncharacterized protein n=1 Tax=Daphnia magna TaxID=35525 RepID=A0ABR0AI62_9CRUS|nr:hypothetical protein OUZ56_010306 [Daphnia magna]
MLHCFRRTTTGTDRRVGKFKTELMFLEERMAGKDLRDLTAEQLCHSESHNSSAIFLIESRAEDLDGSNLGRL